VKKALFMAVLAVCMLALQACSSDVITAAQQKAKKDALQKVADSEKDPNRQIRPQ